MQLSQLLTAAQYAQAVTGMDGDCYLSIDGNQINENETEIIIDHVNCFSESAVQRFKYNVISKTTFGSRITLTVWPMALRRGLLAVHVVKAGRCLRQEIISRSADVAKHEHLDMSMKTDDGFVTAE